MSETQVNTPYLDAPYLKDLNEAQRQAVLQPGHRAVKVLAGAGTGKTELISRRFVKLVEEFQAAGIERPMERILVVTFTDDAATSMRERIHTRLQEMGHDGLPPNAWISTFHKFANRLLQSHAIDVGLAPGFSILDALAQRLLFTRLVHQVKSGSHTDLSDILQAYQLTTLPASVLSLTALQQLPADLASDLLETDLLFNIIARVKASGLTPAEFYQTATRQSQALTEAIQQLPVRFNSDDDSISNMQGYIRDWQRALSGWSEPGWDPIRETEAKHEKPTASKYKDTTKHLANLLLELRSNKIGYVPKNPPDWSGLLGATAVEQNITGIIAALYALYQQTLLLENACDFDDLINHSIQLLSQRPTLRTYYQTLFHTVIVDEFQDSNASQLRLLQLLLREPQPNITVVGDVKQSIYGFRFAQLENMDLVFNRQPHQKIALQTNYRSLPPILEVSNHLTHLLTEDPYQALQPAPKHADHTEPLVTWVHLGRSEETTDAKGKPKTVAEDISTQKDKEARWIAQEIARLVLNGDCSFKDVAVLVRSHRKAEAIQAALTVLSIPSIRRKNLGFFDEPVIKDAMALLALMINLHDNHALVRILQSRLSAYQLRQLAEVREGGASFFQVLEGLTDPAACPWLGADERQALLSLVEQLSKSKKLQSRLSPTQLFTRLSETIGLIHPDTPAHLKKQQRIHLRIFEKLLYKFCFDSPLQPTLTEILETLEHYRQDPNLELPVAEENSQEDAVQIMTVFASKGLEFPVVFVAYTESKEHHRSSDGLLLFDPQWEGKNGFGLILGKYQQADTVKKALYRNLWVKPRGEAEQQRVFYVALTRAKQRLYVLRGLKSADWTHGKQYPSITLLDEQGDPDGFNTRYWQADILALRQTLESHQQQAVLPAPASPPTQQTAVPLQAAPTPTEAITLSFSALNAYDRCPVYYWLKYQWRLPDPPGSFNLAAARGTCLHELIYKHYMTQGQLSENAIAQCIQHHLGSASPEDQAEIQQIFQQFQRSEYAYTQLSGKELHLFPEKQLHFQFEQFGDLIIEMDGVLDLLLVDPKKQTATLLDFKTNRQLTEADQARYFEQLHLYRKGLLKVSPHLHLPLEELYLVHLTPQQVTPIPFQNTALSDLLKTAMTGLIPLIEAGTIPNRPHHVRCKHPRCTFLDVCPQRE